MSASGALVTSFPMGSIPALSSDVRRLFAQGVADPPPICSPDLDDHSCFALIQKTVFGTLSNHLR